MPVSIRSAAMFPVTAFALGALAGCAGGSTGTPRPPQELAAGRTGLTAATPAQIAVPNSRVATAALVAASGAVPPHCRVDGVINPRTGADGKPYAINFRLRMPVDSWNGRFFMGGGGGTNGFMVDPVARVAEGYATIGTDSGHNNTINNVPQAGGTAAFGLDPQARIDFAYASYDQVTRAGKALVAMFYGRAPARSYFMGCSEGGREGLLMTQRFPRHYDGVIAGAPVLHLPLGPMAGVYTTQLFSGLATRSNLRHADGQPAINKTFSDADLLLMRNAVLAACDSLDGLADGIVDNLPACTKALAAAKLAALQCAGAKNDSCLTGDQIATMSRAFDGTFDSAGRQLYPEWQWDAGIATDRFDMLPHLVKWVEQGDVPESVLARASNPGYFNVPARTRLLCPYPKQARYNGIGDVNDAARFSCR